MLNEPGQCVPLSTYPKNDILIPLFFIVIIKLKQIVRDD